jgi:hypothetical protein
MENAKPSKKVQFCDDNNTVCIIKRNMTSKNRRWRHIKNQSNLVKARKAEARTEHSEVWDANKRNYRETLLEDHELKTLLDKVAMFREQGTKVATLVGLNTFFYFDDRTGEVFLCNPEDSDQFWEHPLVAERVQRSGTDRCRGKAKSSVNYSRRS